MPFVCIALKYKTNKKNKKSTHQISLSLTLLLTSVITEHQNQYSSIIINWTITIDQIKRTSF